MLSTILDYRGFACNVTNSSDRQLSVWTRNSFLVAVLHAKRVKLNHFGQRLIVTEGCYTFTLQDYPTHWAKWRKILRIWALHKSWSSWINISRIKQDKKAAKTFIDNFKRFFRWIKLNVRILNFKAGIVDKNSSTIGPKQLTKSPIN